MDKIAIAIICVYVPSLFVAIFLALRHGFGQNAGWLYLVLFSTVRIVGAAFQLAQINDPLNISLITGALILLSVGFSALVLVMLSLLGRVLESIRTSRPTHVHPHYLRAVHLLVVAGLALSIVGGSQMGGIISDAFKSSKPPATFEMPIESKAGMAIMIAGFGIVVIVTAVTGSQISAAEHGEKRLLLAVALAIPFVLVRLIFSSLATFGTNPDFRSFNGSAKYPDYLLGMAVIMEMAAIIIFEAVGLTLIIITGLPTSGKSTRAAQLYSYLSERIASQQQPDNNKKYRLHLISDQTQNISRTVYDLSQLPAHVRSANASEKDARAAIYGAVKRVLSPRDIVVLDGLNYIKGWRYQLYCEAKNMSTPHAVLQVGCSMDRARGVNQARLDRRKNNNTQQTPGQQQQSEPTGQMITQQLEQTTGGGQGGVEVGDEDEEPEPYAPENWENLVFRYEEPNPMTRWDSPLFTLVWDDSPSETKSVFDKLWDAIAGEGKKLVRPNQSTVQRDKDPGGDYLYVLEKETQDIVKRILEMQPPEGGGGEIRISRNGGGETKGEEDELVVELPARKVGLPQLQRYRRAFVGLNRGGIGLEQVGKLAARRLRESFVGYLNDAFEKDG
ncbi:protein kti12 [Diplogelasinospora grovesii]|uniref:Protein kti12 n=1 Tax=Diplogelasinospora grovesii TaxID=303347 RepID=A0AAN6NG92_9PEZI|nr:protein kti12 [Diplogelasinospora grovesii]